ncbi:DUF2851 family protein [Tenacibaculum sp. TC6]|uniref:DUF2851 family protein n=1 Tax=Tenacibaculum sp. TC6 TaxID=3423223 RepID=UPI003D35E3AE
MKEEFLHFLWQQKLLSSQILKTSEGDELVIIKTGLPNRNSGPDFLNVHIQINHQTWVGNVEIHLKSSDWYLHNHEADENYDAVILHVVWEHDTAVFMKNNKALPTLELQHCIDQELLDKYQKLMNKENHWISCEKQLNKVDSFLIKNWQERLYFERLEHKSLLIQDLLVATQNDYEAVLFMLLAKNFGLKVNSEVFFKLANSFSFSVIRKLRFDEFQLSALLFGQAGFLEEGEGDKYYLQLKKEYEYLQHKFRLKAIHKKQFQFFRMRPANFPTIRIAQMVALLHKHASLFAKVIETTTLQGFYELLSVEVNDYWKCHYTFETESKKSSKKITTSFIDLLVINTIIPMKFVYFKNKGRIDEEHIVGLIEQIKPEKNTIISKFSAISVKSKNALDTQALLELKNNYCEKNKCMKCAIGNYLLRK